MAVQITETKNFAFTIPVGETTFNLNMIAKDQVEAVTKLLDALTRVTDELKKILKPGAN